MAQQFANQAQSVLTSAYTAGDTSLYIANGAVFPSTGNFTLAMGYPIQFYLVCTARSGNTLTVTNTGQEGTSTANLAIGSTITQVITAGVLNALRTECLNMYGTYANLSSATGMVSGTRYSCTDFPYDFVYNGSSWITLPRGLDTNIVVPVLSSFSPIGSPSGSFTQNGPFIDIFCDVNQGGSYNIALPSPPYTVIIKMEVMIFNVNYNSVSIGLADANGKGRTYLMISNGGTLQIWVTQNNNSYAWQSDLWNSYNTTPPMDGITMKLVETGANRMWYVGSRNSPVCKVFSEASNTWMTPTTVNWGVGATSSSQASARIYSWQMVNSII